MTFSCNASGDPVPTISWTRDATIISTSGESRIGLRAENNQLNITNVSRADEGEYRCVANNSLRNASCNASASGDWRISFGADNKVLTIANVSRADEGEYRCVANNSLGNASSNAAFLNVQCKLGLI